MSIENRITGRRHGTAAHRHVGLNPTNPLFAGERTVRQEWSRVKGMVRQWRLDLETSEPPLRAVAAFPLKKVMMMGLSSNTKHAYGFKNFSEHSSQLTAAAAAMDVEGLTRSQANSGMFSSSVAGQPEFTIALRASGAFVFFRDPVWPVHGAFIGSSMTDAARKALRWARENAPVAS